MMEILTIATLMAREALVKEVLAWETLVWKALAPFANANLSPLPSMIVVNYSINNITPNAVQVALIEGDTPKQRVAQPNSLTH